MKRILRNLPSSVAKAFDRSFSTGKGKQFLWLLVAVILVFLALWAVSLLSGKDITPVRIIELMLDPGAFQEDGSRLKPRLFQLIAAIMGAFVFTGMLISVVSNYLDSRAEQFVRGITRYRFSGHTVILGANAMTASLVKALHEQGRLSSGELVVLTKGDVEIARQDLEQVVGKKDRHRIFIFYGERTNEAELGKLHLDKAFSVHIAGGQDERESDSSSIQCLKLVREICSRRGSGAHKIKCYLYLDSLSSFHLFKFLDFSKIAAERCGNIELTVINMLESWAQKVLVTGECDGIKYPSIDRNGITADDGHRVHFIVSGMTATGYAMAATAAHLAHYPNFRTKGIRSRITFVAENMVREADYFNDRYEELMKLSHRTYLTWNADTMEWTRQECVPDPAYGDFLDIEWEFVDARIESPEFRELLGKWCVDENSYVTMALCGESPETNLAAAMNLPRTVFDRNIPVFVFQPESGDLLTMINDTSISSRYTNLYPFGMKAQSYGEDMRKRKLIGKIIKFFYDSEYVDGKPVRLFPPDLSRLNEQWYRTTFPLHLSNLYAANSLWTKLRSIGISQCSDLRMPGGEEIEMLAEVEHNRWNIEKLLLGFIPLPAGDPEDKDTRDYWLSHNDEGLKEMKQKCFRHPDIAPYGELPESHKDYDRNIAGTILHQLMSRYALVIVAQGHGRELGRWVRERSARHRGWKTADWGYRSCRIMESDGHIPEKDRDSVYRTLAESRELVLIGFGEPLPPEIEVLKKIFDGFGRTGANESETE